MFIGNTQKDKNDFILKGNLTQVYLQEAIANNDVESLSQLWSQGLNLDWNLLYQELITRPSKISLPTYPFARKRYWFDNNKKESTIDSLSIDKKVSKDVVKDVNIGVSIDEIRVLIASLAKLELEDVESESSLLDLGIDSMMFFSLFRNLSERFPELDMKIHGNELLGASSLNQLTVILNQLILDKDEEIYESKENNNNLENLVLTKKLETINSVLDSVSLLKKSPLETQGIVKVNEEHPFFFDHPLDHVSGIHLAEAMSEVAKASFYYKEKLEPSTSIFIKKLFVSFQEFCKKDELIKAFANEDDSFLEEGIIGFRTSITQNKKKNAQGVFHLSKIGDYEKRIQGTWNRGAIAFDQELMNKLNKNNVFEVSR